MPAKLVRPLFCVPEPVVSIPTVRCFNLVVGSVVGHSCGDKVLFRSFMGVVFLHEDTAVGCDCNTDRHHDQRVLCKSGDSLNICVMHGWRKISKYRRSVRPTHAGGYEQEKGAYVSTPLVEE